MNITYYSNGERTTAEVLNRPLTEIKAAIDSLEGSSSNWDTAFGWGDHAAAGYATETYVDTAVSNLVDSAPEALDTLNELAAALGDDANFSTTVTTSIGTKWTQDNAKISNWDTAYSWGDHSSAGYLTSYTETDPVFSASEAASITSTNTTNWNTAFGWGDHSTQGYLTSFTETDPVFTASAASGIEAADITDWNTAFSWGDHSTQGYLTSFTETEPAFTASEAASITSTETGNWNTAFSWGDHSSAGYLTGISSENLEDLSNVSIASPASGEVLSFDGANWVNTAAASGGSDVDIENPVDGLYIYNESYMYVKTVLLAGGSSATITMPTTSGSYSLSPSGVVQMTSKAASGSWANEQTGVIAFIDYERGMVGPSLYSSLYAGVSGGTSAGGSGKVILTVGGVTNEVKLHNKYSTASWYVTLVFKGGIQ